MPADSKNCPSLVIAVESSVATFIEGQLKRREKITDYRTKTVRLNKDSVAKLPENKPVVYKILDNKGENIYTGVAGRGNVQERILDHLLRGPDPIPGGAKVQIQQKRSIDAAKATEQGVVSRSSPRHNKQGK